MQGEELMNAAIEQLKIAASQLKQQHSAEAKMWQNTAHELQATVDQLQIQWREVTKANAQMKATLDEQTSEIEQLKSVNESLTRTLQQKEQTIANFVALHQSLKGLIDQQESESTASTYMAYETPVSKPVYQQPYQPKVQPQPEAIQMPMRRAVTPAATPAESPKPAASRSSLFIRAAKKELTYSDFNQMITEINMYNRHQQSREDTIENVRKLLCPDHSGLFEQFLPMISGI